MKINEFTGARWQKVINYDVNPGSVAPEPEVKDSRMNFSTLPVLIVRVNYHLRQKSTQTVGRLTIITKLVSSAQTSADCDADPEILDLDCDPDSEKNARSTLKNFT